MLDVLFPLSVPKIIYIDSDQVVRADVQELWNMDLKGKPYAYTPFCDNKKEIEGFRFWKQACAHSPSRPTPKSESESSLALTFLIRLRVKHFDMPRDVGVLGSAPRHIKIPHLGAVRGRLAALS
jgi:hypothetical protein